MIDVACCHVNNSAFDELNIWRNVREHNDFVICAAF